MPNRSSRRPKDANQLGKLIVDLSVGDTQEHKVAPAKNKAAVELGRLGGKKGGAARAAKLSARRRKEIAKIAASARWKHDE